MPFQDDIRRYTFPSLDKLINKKGEILTEHPYLPTDTQLEAMDEFVDAMDLMEAGPKDEEKYVYYSNSIYPSFPLNSGSQKSNRVVRYPGLLQSSFPSVETGNVPLRCRSRSRNESSPASAPRTAQVL